MAFRFSPRFFSDCRSSLSKAFDTTKIMMASKQDKKENTRFEKHVFAPVAVDFNRSYTLWNKSQESIFFPNRDSVTTSLN